MQYKDIESKLVAKARLFALRNALSISRCHLEASS